jgi:hypothetical protein
LVVSKRLVSLCQESSRKTFLNHYSHSDIKSMATALIGHKEAAAKARQISSGEWIKKSRDADHAQRHNAKASSAQYAATMQEEADKLKAKGVFLENRNGVFTEAFCRRREIGNIATGKVGYFSLLDIDLAIKALEMQETWKDEAKSLYRLTDDDNISRLFSIRTEGDYLKIFLIN